MKAGDTAHVTAHGLTPDGLGVAHLDGRALTCAGLFPGESAQVRVDAVSRQHARAHGTLLEIERRHPARRAAPCPRHVAREGGSCTGCPLQELTESAQRDAKAQLLRDRFNLPVQQVEAAPEPWAYRWSSKRVAFGRAGALSLGSYMRGSHAPAGMEGCLVDHALLVQAFASVQSAANSLGIEPYEERSGTGDLRYVWAKTNGQGTIVTLVVAQREGRAASELARAALSCAGVLVSVQHKPGNTMRGDAPRLTQGAADLHTELMGEAVEVGALGFLQPNPRVAELCYAALSDGPAAGGQLAFDLYAGAGVTTRALRRRFAEVVPCESYPESAQALGIVPESSEAFLTRWLSEQPARVPELVIANPPRKGLGEQVCAALARLGSAELRVMSCGPEGLARDLAQLTALGYRLASLQAFDTLPQTAHVELVAKLVRA